MAGRMHPHCTARSLVGACLKLSHTPAPMGPLQGWEKELLKPCPNPPSCWLCRAPSSGGPPRFPGRLRPLLPSVPIHNTCEPQPHPSAPGASQVLGRVPVRWALAGQVPEVNLKPRSPEWSFVLQC